MDFVQGRAASNYLLQALPCNILRKPHFQIEQTLERTPICVFENAVVVALGADDFLLVDYVLAVDHLEEYKLSTQRQHSLFPVFGVPLALLIYPIIGSHFACKRFAISIESPHGCLSALAKFLLENVEFSREFTRLDRFRFIAAGVLLFFDH